MNFPRIYSPCPTRSSDMHCRHSKDLPALKLANNIVEFLQQLENISIALRKNVKHGKFHSCCCCCCAAAAVALCSHISMHGSMNSDA